jgi:hypothetical protein
MCQFLADALVTGIVEASTPAVETEIPGEAIVSILNGDTPVSTRSLAILAASALPAIR